jgi:hypothetical protein
MWKLISLKGKGGKMNKLMKTLAVFLVASLLVGGLAFAKEYKEGHFPPKLPLGYTGEVISPTKYPQEPHKTFRLVRYRGIQRWGSPLSAGSMVLWATGAITGDGVTVTDANDVDSFSGDSRVAGVMVTGVQTAGAGKPSAVVHQYRNLTATADVRHTKSWGWMQTYGKCRVTPDNRGWNSEGAAIYASNLRGKTTTTDWNGAGGSGAVPASDSRKVTPAGWWIDDVGTSSRDVFLRCEE